jgi:hypothetical protein
MALTFLVNGFFRSGTTFLFHELREQFPNHACYYEPCYPKLGLVVQNFKTKQGPDQLHQSSLWNEYAQLTPAEFQSLLRNHPNTDNAGIANGAALFEYLKVFQNLESPAILQTNRYHRYLDAIQTEYNIPVVHIIRNPIAVYHSLLKSYTQRSSGLKKMIRSAIFPFTSKNYFGQETELRQNIEKLGLPHVFYDNWKFRYFKKISFKEKVYINWILANYTVLVNNKSILILFYENILSNPQLESQRITEHLKMPFEIRKAKKPGEQSFNNSEYANFEKVVMKYKLNDMWQILLKEMNAQNVNYFPS